MQTIFTDMMHKHVECYVDDLVVRSNGHAEHRQHLRRVLKRACPLKCAFRVSLGKYLGIIVRHRGIEIDLVKMKAIQDTPPPKNVEGVKKAKLALFLIWLLSINEEGRSGIWRVKKPLIPSSAFLRRYFKVSKYGIFKIKVLI